MMMEPGVTSLAYLCKEIPILGSHPSNRAVNEITTT